MTPHIPPGQEMAPEAARRALIAIDDSILPCQGCGERPSPKRWHDGKVEHRCCVECWEDSRRLDLEPATLPEFVWPKR